MVRHARHTTYRCGGYSSYTGHCGAGDCETCHPGGAAAERAQEAREEWEAEHLDPLREERDALQVTIAKAQELQLDTCILDANLDTLNDKIEEVEDEAPDFDEDGGDYEPDYDDRDYDDDRY
jgi:hypothetical protein